MGKYQYLRIQPKQKKSSQVHPVWRGIGCFMMILMPVIAYAAATILIDANLKNHWVTIPADLNQTVYIPFLHKLVPHFYLNLALTVLLVFIGYGVLVSIYSVIYKLSAPPKYGPYDSPPLR